MLEIVVAIAGVAIVAVSVPMAIWLYRRERDLRRTLREQEPGLDEKEIRKRARRIMNDR